MQEVMHLTPSWCFSVIAKRPVMVWVNMAMARNHVLVLTKRATAYDDRDCRATPLEQFLRWQQVLFRTDKVWWKASSYLRMFRLNHGAIALQEFNHRPG